ncbi:hypothetical protein PIB30_062754 [Stylosanthes scabra]|uniref:Uncharacterized protein n=1 Tax=Stylosanthes scabra TaxID=79078 RepID=A0ABU6TL16_9FABA|nr:hypothetical protein [Stylosanthes scabra]
MIILFLGRCGFLLYRAFAGDGILTMIIKSTKGTFVPPVLAEGTWLKPTTFDSGEPYLGLILSNRRVREDLFSPLSFFTMRPIAPFSPGPASSTSSSTSSGSVGSVHWERSRSPRTPLPPMAPAPVYPVPRTPMCDAQRYRSLFPHRRVAPPTPPPPSPPSSDKEPSVETYNPAAELVGDPDESYVAERVLHGAPEAYYLDTSYGSEHESASTDTTPSSHHSSGISSGSVSLGYGSASSGSASDGASDDDLVWPRRPKPRQSQVTVWLGRDASLHDRATFMLGCGSSVVEGPSHAWTMPQRGSSVTPLLCTTPRPNPATCSIK